MKKILFLVFAIFTQSLISANAQNTPDSLYQELKKNYPDTTIIEININLANYYQEIFPDSSYKYAQKAYKMAVSKKHHRSIVSSCYNLGTYFLYARNMDSSLFYNKKALEISKKTGDNLLVMNSYIHLADVYTTENLSDTAIFYYKKAFELLGKSEKNLLYKATILNNIGNTYLSILEYDKALENFIAALEIFNKLNQKDKASVTLNNIGRIYIALRQYEDAIKYFNRAIALNVKNNSLYNLSMNYLNLGIVFGEDQQFDSALFYYQKASDIASKNGFIMLEAKSLYNSGVELINMGEYDNALEVLKKSSEICEKNGVLEGLVYNNMSLAKTYSLLGEYYKAIEILKNAIETSKQIGLDETLESLYSDLSKNYQEINDYKKAFYYHNIADSIADSTLSLKVYNQINELEAKYESEKNKQEIANLKLRDEINSVKIQRQNYLILSISFGLIVLIIFIFYLLASRKRTKQLIEKLEVQNTEIRKQSHELQDLNATKDKLFSIIAHDLRNPMATVIGFTDLLKQDFKSFDDNIKLEYVGYINEGANKTFKLLENLLTWSRTQMGEIKYNPEKVDIEKTASEIIDLSKEIAGNKNIKLKPLLVDDNLVVADKQMLTTILLNLVNNAIKFTPENGEVNITSEQVSEGKLKVCVKDTGVGISKENIQKLFRIDQSYSTTGTKKETGTGLGLIIVNEFIEKHNSKIEVESEPGIGSCFSFILQLAK
jgi:signal transduction histidine kinase/Tfp pilus assembly protein PilF